MIDYNIVSISKVKTNQLFEFYGRVFKNRSKILTENWKWWYRHGYLGYESIVLISKDKILGQAGLIPTKIKIKNEIIPAIWFVDFAVLHEHQGFGIGKILTKEWMKICPNQITFCNDHSLRIFKKFGWASNKNTKRLAKPLDPIKWIPFSKIFKLNIFSSIYQNLLKKKYDNFDLIKPYEIKNNYKLIFESFKNRHEKNSDIPKILRDESWLSWRLMECPFNKNIYFFEYKGNFSIVHIIKTKKIKRLHILYNFRLKESKEENLLNFIFKWALENSIDLVWANSNDKEQIKNYENFFSQGFTKSMNFASWSADKKIHETLKFGLTNSKGIDSDNDIHILEDSYL